MERRMDRLLKLGRTWFPLLCQGAARNLSVSSRADFSRLAREAVKVHGFRRAQLESLSNSTRFCAIFPAMLAGSLVGACLLDTSYAADGGIEKFVRQERERLEELLRCKGMQQGSYPPFVVTAKGPQVLIKFQASCELIHLIMDLVSHLGQKTDEREGSSEIMLRTCNREIEDAILLALTNTQLYDAIAHGTRQKFESNRPRAVLFEGPPGTGKTSCARVIANQANIPLLYVPLEAVMSKYYGESERLLGTVFTLANDLSTGAIVFLDEVDSFAATRDSQMHEATRRILSVLLRQIDGFEQDKQVVIIAATNRKQDLDPALMSRFDSVITFGLPDYQDRQKIIMQYAKHLNTDELAEFASVSEGMSGRDIRDVCQCAERHWASKIIRGETPDSIAKGDLPPLEDYLETAIRRRQKLLDFMKPTDQKPNSHIIHQSMAVAS